MEGPKIFAPPLQKMYYHTWIIQKETTFGVSDAHILIISICIKNDLRWKIMRSTII